MTDLKFTILEKLYNADGRRMSETDLINEFPGQRTNARHEIEKFVARGQIKRPNDYSFELTAAGEDLYETTLEANQEKEYLRKQNKTSRTIAILSVIAAGIAALVPFIEFILSLFGIAFR